MANLKPEFREKIAQEVFHIIESVSFEKNTWQPNSEH
jgi:hypothetical protein